MKVVFENVFVEDSLGYEYEKALLLNYFSKLCNILNNDDKYYNHILSLYRQSFDENMTTKIIFRKKFDFYLSDSQSNIMTEYVISFFKKNGTRKQIGDEIKLFLMEKQNNTCPICFKNFGSDLSIIHVDHIIPWKLVGDELKDNYQCLCDVCNKRKNDRIDYILKSILHLN